MTTPSDYGNTYIRETLAILGEIDLSSIEGAVAKISSVTDRGRLFTLGVGGSAATASHAAADFRKMCGIEAYHLTDNLAEFSARINDDGWNGAMRDALQASRLNSDDVLLIFSVGGGSRGRGLSVPLVEAAEYAAAIGASSVLIAGRDGGDIAKVADVAVIIPPVTPERVTCHTEGIAMVLLHLLVSHPSLVRGRFTWEGQVLVSV